MKFDRLRASEDSHKPRDQTSHGANRVARAQDGLRICKVNLRNRKVDSCKVKDDLRNCKISSRRCKRTCASVESIRAMQKMTCAGAEGYTLIAYPDCVETGFKDETMKCANTLPSRTGDAYMKLEEYKKTRAGSLLMHQRESLSNGAFRE